jgi:hypothetical protein
MNIDAMVLGSRIYDILVEHAGAAERGRLAFCGWYDRGSGDWPCVAGIVFRGDGEVEGPDVARLNELLTFAPPREPIPAQVVDGWKEKPPEPKTPAPAGRPNWIAMRE